MPASDFRFSCQYKSLQAGTQTNTATFTVNPGQAGEAAGLVGVSGNLPSTFGVFYGVTALGLGTNTTTGTGTGGVAQVVTAYDLIPPTGVGTNTATVTNQLMVGTLTAAGSFAGPQAGGSIGVRYFGALVVVISGSTTLGTANCLFD